MSGMTKEDALAGLTCCMDECENIPVIKSFERQRIKSSGYVVDTFEAAVWCFVNTENYRDCVIAAVELGNDTDTVAAVAGGLAGIYYGIGGEKGIPEEWINSLAKKEMIDEILNNAKLS